VGPVVPIASHGYDWFQPTDEIWDAINGPVRALIE
jgi:hypothetical protein